MGRKKHSQSTQRSENTSPSISVGRVFRYAFAPEFFPRIRRFGQVWAPIAYGIALVLASARLVPPNHPYLRPSNIGKFGVVSVFGVAANNLVLARRNIDQLLILGAAMLAVLMIAIQAVIIAICVVFAPHSAEASSSGGMFTSPNPDSDVVLTFLQQTIGLDGFFNGSRPVGFSIAGALHQILGFYSMGMMIIATCIVIYYVITVVGESAQTGTPFGRRFNGLWAPIRLVLALGLLVPLGNGLNAAQYAVLSVAKLGSGFATQAWNKFSHALLTDPDAMLPPVTPMGFTTVAKSIFLYEVCAEAYNLQNPGDAGKLVAISKVVPKGVNSSLAGAGPTSTNGIEQVNSIAFNWEAKTTNAVNPRNSTYSCGSLKIDYSLARKSSGGKALSEAIIRAYSVAIDSIANSVRPIAKKYAASVTPYPGNALWKGIAPLPDAVALNEIIKDADAQVGEAVAQAYRSNSEMLLQQALGTTRDLQGGGWGSAANYYLRLARANQLSLEITQQTMPMVANSAKLASSVSRSEWVSSWFDLQAWSNWWDGSKDGYSRLGKQAEFIKAAVERAQVAITWAIPDAPGRVGGSMDTIVNSSGAVPEAIYWIFGGSQLWELADPAKQNVFPMVKLTQLGSDILSRAAKFFAGGVILSSFNATASAGSFILTMAFVGIGVGFILSYVLPLMPFMYFFFAIVEWVMGVVEGLVGAPLWALAHLRIDGDGIPGQAAMNGYQILFSILLRPILILFSLLASFVIFNSGAYFLNLIFGDVVFGDVTKQGNDLGMFGYVGYLIMYAVIVYNLGLVCFKMIDQIPAQVMRWMGQSNLHYQDGKPDPIGNTTQVAAAAGTFLGPQLANSLAGPISKAGLGTRGLNAMRGLGKGTASASVP